MYIYIYTCLCVYSNAKCAEHFEAICLTVRDLCSSLCFNGNGLPWDLSVASTKGYVYVSV